MGGIRDGLSVRLQLRDGPGDTPLLEVGHAELEMSKREVGVELQRSL